LPLVVSGVVSPRPKLSFGPSLPVGVEGRQEFLDLSLTRKAPGVVAALNEHLPEGLLVRRARYLPPGAKCAHAPVQRARYCVRIPVHREASLRTGVRRFQECDSRIIERSKGGVTTSMDLKSQITALHTEELGEDGVLLHFECDLSGEGSKLRPHEFVASLLDCSMEDISTLTLHREQLLSRGGEPLGPWKSPMELVEFAMRRSRQMVKRYS
jgi:radical SAM-linked protein